MDRRDFFKTANRTVRAKKTGGKSQAMLFAGLAPYTGSWTVNEVTHLLKRTMFGAKKVDVDYFLSRTPDEAVEELLNTSFNPAPPLRDYGLLEDEGVWYDDLGVAVGQTWVNDPNTASFEGIRG